MHETQDKVNTLVDTIRSELSISVLDNDPIVHEHEDADNNTHEGSRFIAFDHIRLNNTLTFR